MSGSLPSKGGKYLLDLRLLFLLYCCIAVAVTIQQYNLPGELVVDGRHYTAYNNYVIFKASFTHLLKGSNLYAGYPQEQFDLYKYSPTFAAFMGLLAPLPDFAGLLLWNALNVLVLFLAIRGTALLPRNKALLLWFLIIELVTSQQNSQSNALLAGLIVLGFNAAERRKMALAALLLVAAAMLKFYGAAAFCILLFYRGRWKGVLWLIVWTVVLVALPLLLVTPASLLEQYRNWYVLIGSDASASFGMSVMGVLHAWAGCGPEWKLPLFALGAAMLAAQWARWRQWSNGDYRLLFLASLLVWLIIFNLKAESPTFIIAVTGVGLWYFNLKNPGWRLLLPLLVLVFTCLSPSDVFPAAFRKGFLEPYYIKAVPCILSWLVMYRDGMRIKRTQSTIVSSPA